MCVFVENEREERFAQNQDSFEWPSSASNGPSSSSSSHWTKTGPSSCTQLCSLSLSLSYIVHSESHVIFSDPNRFDLLVTAFIKSLQAISFLIWRKKNSFDRLFPRVVSLSCYKSWLSVLTRKKNSKY